MIPVTTPAAFDAWRARPGHSWILKHSRTCPVSAVARVEVEAYEKAHPRDPVGIIVVQDHRAASDHVAAALGVVHQSPQLFLLLDGKMTWNASHGDITCAAMEMLRIPTL